MIADPRPALTGRIHAEQEAWREVVGEVGERVDEPGPMGDWTFRDLAAHLLGWRERTIHRLEAVAEGRPDPPDPWPAEIGERDDDDKSINDWIQDQSAGRSAAEVLADIDTSYDRLAAALERIPAETLTDPDGIPWLDGEAAADVDWLGHWHDEHEASVRAWLGRRG